MAHLHDGLVELVHLGLGQRLVGVLLAQRRDGVDDDIHTGVGRLDRLNARLIILNKFGGGEVGVQVVGAEGQDDPAGLHQSHRLRHGHIAAVAAEFDAGKAGQGPGRHAHRTDGVIVAAIVEHAVHAGGVAVSQEEGVIDIFLPRIVGLGQDGGFKLGGIDGMFVLIIAALHHHRFTVYSLRLLLRAAKAVYKKQRNPDADQQHHTAKQQHHVHFGAGIHRRFFALSCHNGGPFLFVL